MTYSLLISDLHLDPARPEHLAALETLLDNHAGKADRLYVLGDLFEAWIGDDDDSPFNRQAIDAFRRFSDAGSELFFMHGNRDFMLGDDFAAACGGTLLDEGTVVDLYGTHALLMHGDSLCTDDLEYMRMRRWLRNPASRLLLRNLPKRTRYKLGRKLRDESQNRTRMKAAEITDVNLGAVAHIMREKGVKTLIHGHTHRPAIHDLMIDGKPAQRIVLGDWDQAGWALEVDENGKRLEAFAL